MAGSSKMATSGGYSHVLLDGGNLIAGPLGETLDHMMAFLQEHRLPDPQHVMSFLRGDVRPRRDHQLSRFERESKAAQDFAQMLRFLLPLNNNMPTRYLLAETTSPEWLVLVDNHARARVDRALTAYLTKVLRTRAIGWNCREHTLRQRDGELIGHPGGSNFYTQEDGSLVRSIDCVYEGTWRFAQFGTPYDFEHVSRYKSPKKRGRLTCEMVKEYLAAFAVSPWEEGFYRVTAEHPAQGVRFVSEDPSVNAWLDPTQ